MLCFLGSGEGAAPWRSICWAKISLQGWGDSVGSAPECSCKEPSLEAICERQLEARRREKVLGFKEGNSLCEESEGRRKRAQKQKNDRQGSHQGKKGKEGVSVKKEKLRIQGEARKRGSGTPGESER